MPLEIEFPRSRVARQSSAEAHDSIVIGLINNMPEAALEATEVQFAGLLRAAAAPLPVRLRFSSLPEVPRGRAGLDRVNGDAYWPIDELLREGLDALIVTGAEPCAPRLCDEPYWERIGDLLRWAEVNTTSSIWSCLAAHAAVEHLDGIKRRRLEHKRSGVFAHAILREHALLRGVSAPLSTPHSRWNELPVDALRDAGYTIASSSSATGADMFTKQGRSLLVFFQGHPEYEEATLLKEYRRDVGRFLRAQQAHYPTLPDGYFSPEAIALLRAFQAQAVAAPSPDLIASFPAADIKASLKNTWGAGATGIYRNWLALLAAAKNMAPAAKVS
jgi:homoserine O-succinyltransferase/O-acetyltransferase